MQHPKVSSAPLVPKALAKRMGEIQQAAIILSFSWNCCNTLANSGSKVKSPPFTAKSDKFLAAPNLN